MTTSFGGARRAIARAVEDVVQVHQVREVGCQTTRFDLDLHAAVRQHHDLRPSGRLSETIGEILPEAARRFGDKVALVVGTEAFSFSELDSMSNRVANGLVGAGVEPGDRVTLYGPNCWEWLVAYDAIAKSGAVVNPISSMFTADEVRYVVADSGARVVVAAREKGIPVLDLIGTANLSSVVLWGDDVPDGATSFTTWLDDTPRDFAPVQRGRGDLAAVCYTFS